MSARRGGFITACVAALLASYAHAEPAFAVRTGYSCSQCHMNRTGGGLRTPFGSVYTQTTLPVHLLSFEEARGLLPADPGSRVGYGADARFQYQRVESDDAPDVASYEVSEANVYLEGRLIPGRLSVYIDETVGPGSASAREAFGMLGLPWGHAWIKAGKFLPAYGFRLPDDDSFIRQSTGFTYSAPDTGFELGAEPGRWSLAFSATNGAGGGSDDDRAKRVALRVERRFKMLRVGLSAADNDSAGASTTASGVFGGGSWGRLTLLGEADRVEVESEESDTERLIGYIEADLLVARGVNLKYVHDWLDPDTDVETDERTRDSIGLEVIPIPFVQARLFVRIEDGPPQVVGVRDDSLELEIHLFF